MWTRENRGLYERKGARYPSDLRDEEWALIAPLIPPAKRGGRRREVDVREVMNGILYVLETGCQWRALPKDLPPKSTVHDYLMLWDWDGTLERVHHALYLMTRELTGNLIYPQAVKSVIINLMNSRTWFQCVRFHGKYRSLLLSTM